MTTILKIKAGLLPPDGPTEHLLRRSQERAPDTVEIMLQITRENVRKTLNFKTYIEISTQCSNILIFKPEIHLSLQIFNMTFYSFLVLGIIIKTFYLGCRQHERG